MGENEALFMGMSRHGSSSRLLWIRNPSILCRTLPMAVCLPVPKLWLVISRLLGKVNPVKSPLDLECRLAGVITLPAGRHALAFESPADICFLFPEG